MGEGEFMRGTRVSAGRDDWITVAWTDASRTRVFALKELGGAWHTPEGIHVGSTLEQLEAAIGSFQVLGFGWDAGGTVMLYGTKMESAAGVVFFRLRPRDPATLSTPAGQRVVGDNPYPSNSSDVRSLGLVVDHIDVVWR